jgi:trimeric autotransporter adhesin
MISLPKILALALIVIAPLAARAQNISTVAGGGPGNNVSPTSVSIGAPAAVRQDSLKNTYILDNFGGRIYRIDASGPNAGKMSVFAGNGTNGFSGEGGLATDAAMSGPSGLCIDANDNVYVADSDNAIIREIPITNVGVMTANHIYTVVGVQTETNFTYGGDGGAATSAHLHFPDGCSFDSHGNMYIADRGNNAIRVVIGASGIPPVGVADNTPGNIDEFAGAMPSGGNPPAPGVALDGSAALGASLNGPFDVFVDSQDNVWIGLVGNPPPPMNPPATANLVRVVHATGPSMGKIQTVAGTTLGSGYNGQNILATSAQLSSAQGIFVDAAGNLFFADSGNQVIREVPAVSSGGKTAGNIYDVAGTAGHEGFGGDGGPATSSGLAFPSGTFVDANGNLFIADSVTDRVRIVAGVTVVGPPPMTSGNIYTFAGNGTLSSSGDGGLATNAQLSLPAAVSVDANGNLLIAEATTSNNQAGDMVREVLSGSTNIQRVAGKPEANGYNGDNQLAINAFVNNPNGMFVDSHNNVFLADSDNCIVREILASTGKIITVAGTIPDENVFPETFFCGFGGDGAGATAAGTMVNHPDGVAVDANGNVFIADTRNHVIRVVIGASATAPVGMAGPVVAGNIYTFAGTPQTPGANGDNGPANLAGLHGPTGIFFDIFGNLFIADTGNHVIREVPGSNISTPNPMTAGNIYTVAGNHLAGFSGDGASATAARLSGPFSVVVDHAGNLFIADTQNHIIRKVTASNGNISTVGGTHGSAGFSGDGAAASSAQLNFPEGLALDGAGDLLIADSANQRVRSIAGLAATTMGNVPVASFDKTTLSFPPQFPNTTSTGQVITLTNTGGATLHISGGAAGVTVTGTNAAEFNKTTTCGASLAAGLNCTITVTFTPNAVGAFAASVSIADDAFGHPQLVTLNGTGGAPTATLNPSTPLGFGNQVVNTASASKPVTVTNNGNLPLTITAIAFTGANSGDFSETDNCPKSPSAVAVNGSCTINVTFKPTATGARAASLSITDNAANSPQTLGLTGTGIAPAVNLGSASLTFSNQVVGTTSTPAQTVTLTNNGTAALTITTIAVGGANSADFGETDNCPKSPTTIAANGSCTISVTFTPSATGPRAASISIADDASGSPQAISLTGTGVAPGVGLSANSLTFAAQTLNTTSAAQSVTLTNTGTSVLNITGITITGANASDYGQTNTCGTSVAAGKNCTINVTFTPAANGSRTASVSIADNASNSPQTVSLTGSGDTPAASFSITTLNFSNQQLGKPSAVQAVTLTNGSTVPLAISGITVTGANAADFKQTNNCGAAVAAGGNCTISVTFTPSVLMSETASVMVADNAAASPQSITLNGNGVAPGASLSTSTLTFADQFVGTTSATAQTVTLTNNGSVPLTINGITVSGDYTQTNTCGTSVPATANCTISVTFTPGASGARPASITITDNAPSGTQTVSLTGSGFTISLAAASGGSMSQTVKAGQTATYNLQLTSAGGAPADQISVAVACSGAPALATCNAPSAPVVVTSTTPGTFAITIATAGNGTLVSQPQSEPNTQPPAALRLMPLTVLALLLCIAAMLATMHSPTGRMRTASIALTACLVLMPVTAATFLAGCAGGGGSNSTPPPTPESAPTITTQPANQTAPVGQAATFTVVATGTAPLTYQWQKNGTAISGATSANYTTPATTVADNGSTFAVVVSNAAGNATSSNAKLSLSTPPNTYAITVTTTVNGKAQISQLTLVVQ